VSATSIYASILARTLLVGVLFAPGLKAQFPGAPQTPPVREETSDDPLGRSTPHGAVLGFIRAASRGDYNQAANYLDTKQHGDLARELAQQLQTVLDRETTIDLNNLSRRPEGSLANPQNTTRDLVGVASTSSGRVEIWLDRVQRGDNPPIWLFSKDTLLRVPEIYQEIGAASEIEQRLPAWLKPTVFTVSLWKWLALIAAVPLVFLFGSVVARFLELLVAIITARILGDKDITHARGVVAPVRLILLGLLSLACASYSDTLLRRHFCNTLGNVLLVFGTPWLSMKIIGIATSLGVLQLKRVRSSDRIAFANLVGRLLQIIVVVAGTLVVLHLAGVNLTAALTGLGIGGIAVALAAQRTLENLFGGIMIISDRPVRVGDFCRIGTVMGNIVDVGLRSTRIRTLDRTIVTIPNGQLATMNLENYSYRDKFWFHPIIMLGYQTTVDQMHMVLHNIRELLDSHANVESGTARVRFINIGKMSRDVEVFAYILAVDYNEFLGIQEDLLVAILEIVESTGTPLAVPIQVTRVVRDSDSKAQWPKARQ